MQIVFRSSPLDYGLRHNDGLGSKETHQLSLATDYSEAASVSIPHWRTISSMVRAVSSWAMSTMSPA